MRLDELRAQHAYHPIYKRGDVYRHITWTSIVRVIKSATVESGNGFQPAERVRVVWHGDDTNGVLFAPSKWKKVDERPILAGQVWIENRAAPSDPGWEVLLIKQEQVALAMTTSTRDLESGPTSARVIHYVTPVNLLANYRLVVGVERS